MKLTAIILAKNEEKNISLAIKSVSFCDEVIVVDDASTDKTIERCKMADVRCKILKHDSKGDFAGQRNWAIEQASNQWILFLDADEEVTAKLKSEISQRLSKSYGDPSSQNMGTQDFTPTAFSIKRRDFWWGRELKFGETMKVRNKGLIRLMKKDEGVWVGRVHERFISTGKAGVLSSFINHYPHPTLKDFIADVNTYSTIRARELMDMGVHFSMSALILLPLGKFILNYFFYLGFLDGPAGFAYAFLMSFHSFLVRAKLYQYTNIDTAS